MFKCVFLVCLPTTCIHTGLYTGPVYHCVSIYIPIYLYPSILTSINPSLHPSIHLSVSLFVCLSIYLFICLSIYISSYVSAVSTFYHRHRQHHCLHCLSSSLAVWLPSLLHISYPVHIQSTCNYYCLKNDLRIVSITDCFRKFCMYRKARGNCRSISKSTATQLQQKQRPKATVRLKKHTKNKDDSELLSQ